MQREPDPNSPAGIMSRVQFPEAAELSPTEARFILQLGISDADCTRLRELLGRNREDELSPGEQEELENLLAVSYFFDILHSKARLALKRPDRSGTAA